MVKIFFSAVRLLLLLLIFPAAAAGNNAKSAPALQFGKEGTFKIIQITDLHWNDRSPRADSTELLLREVLRAEKPDLVVITGDIVTSPPAREGWNRIAAVMRKSRVRWTVTLGNHDDEADMRRKDLFGFLASKPYFLGYSVEGLHGDGNHVLEVISADGSRVAALLYMLDSHNKPAAHRFGNYDWIRSDQIEWYRTTSNAYTAGNGGSPLPALMFFHIPPQEYAYVAAKKTFTETNGMRVSSSGVNSGLFSSLLEMGDVMGVFTGHDHDNDFIGEHMDIALAYGRVSGYDAGSRLPRGVRVIELTEDSFAFDTRIRTREGVGNHYSYRPGFESGQDDELEYLPATDIEISGPGVDYLYYEGGGARLRSTADIRKAAVVRRGVLENISIETATAADSMAFVFTTWIKIPQKGVYNFYTCSDDGSVLNIDGIKVVDNDGGHSLRRRDGAIALQAGYHKLEVLYFDDYMGQGLEVGFSGPGIRETVLPGYMLFRGNPL